MRFNLQAVATLALATECVAFTSPAILSNSHQSTLTEVSMVKPSFEKAAMSFFTAGVFAVSTATTVLPISPAEAATKVVVDEKAALKAMSKEEREKVLATKNLNLAQETVKEYTKIVTNNKAVESKARSALKTEEKKLDAAKKKMIKASQKVTAAKKQKMPLSGIKELTAADGE